MVMSSAEGSKIKLKLDEVSNKYNNLHSVLKINFPKQARNPYVLNGY